MASQAAKEKAWRKESYMKDYFNILKRYRLTIPLIWIIILSSITEVIPLIETKVFQMSVNSIGTSTFLKFLIALIFIEVFNPIYNRAYMGYKVRVKENFAMEYANALYAKSQHLAVKDLQDFSIPKITTEIHTATEMADNILLLPCNFINCSVAFITAFIIMMNEDPELTLILMILTAFAGFGINHILPGFKKMIEDIRNANDRINSCINHLEGYLVTKSFAKEEKEIEQIEEASLSYRDACVRKIIRVIDGNAIVGVLFGLIDVVIVIYINQTYAGDLAGAISKALLFYSLYYYLFLPFRNMPDIIDRISKIMVHLKTDEEILRMEDEYNGDVEITAFNDSIEFKNVSFSYGDSDSTLKNINIRIPKGSHVGIYGKSGCGKSTFVNLINRFFLVDEGEVLIDGVNINEFTSKSLRRIVGNVNQEITLFSDMSIRDNIKYGINCTDVEMVKAAKLAHCHEFIKELPDGYDSMIGNNGVKLSGGERQRIAIARLFLLNPPILVLDEATSKLDGESELLIKESIDKLSKDKTVISIAHRFNTIENSDLFIGIKDHTIYECGRREDICVPGSLWNQLQGKKGARR
jgi:ABC-type multidrug transport system fused ATPase/permease subunit